MFPADLVDQDEEGTRSREENESFATDAILFLPQLVTMYKHMFMYVACQRAVALFV
jgi:hypothetical protein